MKAGDTITLVCGRQNPLGAPATGRTAVDFILSVNGTLISGATFTELGTPSNSAWDFYSFTFTTSSVAGDYLFAIETAPTAYSTDVIENGLWSGPLDAYDSTAVANLILTSQGTPAITSANSSSIGDIVDGNAYLSPVLTMPAGKLSPFGITDISASGISLEASVMAAPGGTPYPVTITLVSGPLLQFTFGWNANSTAGAVLWPNLTTQALLAWFVDIRVVKAGPPQQIITTNRYTFNQVWRRDTRTS